MKRAMAWFTLVGLALALTCLLPGPAFAEGKLLPHQQPAGGEAGGVADYSTFDNPAYYYAPVRVAPSGTYYRQAGLSPDGAKIVAQKSWNDGTYNRVEVVLMDADGSNETVISPGDSGQGDIQQYGNPFWSDDGTAVGYVEAHLANPNKVVRYDLVTQTRAYIYEPVSPLDANNADFLGASTSALVFWDTGPGTPVQYDLFTWDGTTRVNITNSAEYKEYEPVSNADGTVIVYWSGETTAEPVNTTHTLTYAGGTWTKDVGFSPISDSCWSGWSGKTDNYIATTVMSSKDIMIYDSSGALVTDLTGTGYSGGSGQWNFFGVLAEGPSGNWVITSNAARGATPGRDIVCAASRQEMYVAPPPLGSDTNCGTEASPFATVQKGVTEVASGGTVHVAAGTYVENVVIGKPLTLLGANRDTTIIDGGGSGIVVLIQAPSGAISDVTVSGFTVQNSGVNPLADGGIGLILASNCFIADNNILDNNIAVAVLGSDGNTITGNVIDDSAVYGIVLDQVPGNDTLVSEDNIITGNAITDSTLDGIYVGKDSDGQQISCNTIGGALGSADLCSAYNMCDADGVYFWKSAGNTVTNNTITGNALYGIELMGSADNTITGNVLAGNGEGVRIRLSTYPPGAYPSTGNTMTSNSIAGNTTAAIVAEADVDASGNWYGTFDPAAVAAAVSDYVDYTPWLASAADASGDCGFQGDYSALWVDDDSPQTGIVGRIQEGVDLVSGSTVHVAAGTYVESGQMVIDTNLSIIGADKATTLVKPGSDTGGGSDDSGAWILVDDGITFNLSKVTLDGAGKKVRQGIRYKGSGTVDDVEIKNMVYSGYLGWGIAQGWTSTTAMDLVVTNSTFTNFGRVGILVDEGAFPSTATISGNVFTGKGDGDHLDYAIEVEGGAAATIESNVISGCRGVASSDGSTSAGILVTTYFAPGTQATITGNTLTDNSTAIAVGYGGSDTSSVSAHDNCMSDNDYGVTSTAPLVDATQNWWGDASGPAHASNPNGAGDEVSDDVDFLPWLDECGGALTGPVHCSSPDGWFLTIQGGIDACDAGATVSVSPGTFAEDLVIDKALTLECANVGIDPNVVPSARGPETIIVPATDGWDTWGTIIDLQGSNVTIDGCTFDGDNPTLTDGYSMGGADINANAAIDNGGYYVVDHLRVQNNIIKNLLFSSIYLDTPYGENHSSNYIVHNLFDNMWEGIQIYAAETDVSYNVFDNVTRGVSYHQVNVAPDAGFTPQIANNTVNVVYNWLDTERNVGIFVNGRTGTAAPFSIVGNTVNTSSAMPAGKVYWGYTLWAVTGDRALTFSGNTVNGGGNCDVGLWAWYLDSSSPVVLGGGGGLYGIKTAGVLLSNYHSTWGAGSTALTLSGLPITMSTPGAGTLVLAWEGTTEPAGGSFEPLRSGRSLLAPDHKVPEASDTSLTITSGTYSGGAIGIDLDGASATVTGATISGNGTGVYIHNGGSGTFADNCIEDNTSFGMDNTTGAPVTAGLNWWGDATGPYHATLNPTGTGNPVSDDVSFAPWIADTCHGSATAGDWLNLRTGAFSTLAGSLAAAATGDTIQGVCSGTTPIPGGGTAVVANVTIDLNGCVAGPGSSFVTVTANDVMVLGPGVLDGAGSADPAIVVKAGAGNFILQGVEVRGWLDGVFVEGSVVSFKMGENFIHDNTGAALHVGTGVTLGGVVTVEGNLFKDNGGPGVVNEGATVPLDATYNSWGDLLGPAGPLGDGVGADVTSAPWTFAELFLDMAPDTEAVERHVVEATGLDIKLKADAAKLYGVTFTFTYDTAKLTLNTTTFAAPWAGRCNAIPGLPAGTIGYYCSLLNETPPDPEWDADGGTIATFHFTAFTGTPGNGPWTALFDISHLEVDTGASAIGGQKVFVNNAGFNDPTIPERDITDVGLDDGRIIIERLASFTGYVDLQGRLNDSLAAVRVYDQALRSGAVELANGTSASSGAYTTVAISPHWLGFGNTYYLAVDRWLYLPTTPLASPSFYNSRLLDGVPSTPLPKAFLLGGDATNNEEIDIGDLSCIGGDYNRRSGFNLCGGTGLSDVNEDNWVNVQDLSMAGGNLYKEYSPWTVP